MRTDCTIDHKQVVCPNSSRIGYSRVTARTGDFIEFWDCETKRLGRVICRIVRAPNLDNSAQPLRNMLCIAVSFGNGYAERWIKPEDVQACYRWREVIEAYRKHAEDFFSEDFARKAFSQTDIVRRAANELWSTISAFEDWLSKRTA